MALKFESEEPGRLKTVFVAEEKYQGIPGLLHGGVISFIFDELTAAFCLSYPRGTMTARLLVKFLKPIRIGQKVAFEAHLAGRRQDLLLVDASARDEEGVLRASARALLKLMR